MTKLRGKYWKDKEPLRGYKGCCMTCRCLHGIIRQRSSVDVFLWSVNVKLLEQTASSRWAHHSETTEWCNRRLSAKDHLTQSVFSTRGYFHMTAFSPVRFIYIVVTGGWCKVKPPPTVTAGCAHPGLATGMEGKVTPLARRGCRFECVWRN